MREPRAYLPAVSLIVVQGTVKKLYHSPKGMGESAVGVRMVMLISCLIYVFILKAKKKANKYYKM